VTTNLQPWPTPEPLRVLDIPDNAPPILASPSWQATAATQALSPWLRPYGPGSDKFVQGMLAVSFGDDDPDDQRVFGPQRTGAGDLPDPHAWAGHIAQAVVEVLAGTRPAPQLIRWTSPEVYATVTQRHALAARRGVAKGRRAVIRSVRVCEPADGVAEVCAVVLDGQRVRALAMRLEGLDRRWLLCALQIG